MTPPDDLTPGSGAQVLPLPGVGMGEIFFYASVKRVDDLATFAQEVAALAHDRQDPNNLQTWHPASVDFRAISIRSAPRKPLRADAEINSLDGLFRMLAEPAARFNFFAYLQIVAGQPPIILMNGQVHRTHQSVTPSVRNGVNLAFLDTQSINRITQLIATAPSDPLVLALTAIHNTNAATGQAIVDETGAPLRRQLRLYLCSADASVTHPLPFVDPALGQALAQLLAMDVFMLPMALWFRPELQLQPLDQLRGQVSTMPDGPITQDIHTLDSFADQFP